MKLLTPYWKLWWWRHGRAEARFVKRALQLATENRVTYIHPNGRVRPVAAIIRVEDLNMTWDWEDHDHVEGREE